MRSLYKFIAGFFLGFSINYLWNMYTVMQDVEILNMRKSCPKQSVVAEETDLSVDLNVQLPESYKARDMYDLLRYEYISNKYMYGNFDNEPKIRILGHQKNGLKGILSQALTLFKHKNVGDWKIRKFHQAYRRLDPQRGEEYSITVNISDVENPARNSAIYQLDLVKPFSPAQLIRQRQLDTKTRLYIIVPVFNATEKFQKFLSHFEKVCLKTQNPVVLVVVSFLSGKDNDGDTVGWSVQALSAKYGNKYFRYVRTFRPFSRGFGIDLAIKDLPGDKLLFFCDLDMTFTLDFLHRCRTNAIRSKQVFYPVVFAQYHPSFVRTYSPISENRNLMDINKSTGHWVHYGYGIACMYAEDYRKVGGFDLTLKGWGSEDVDLFQKHVKSELKVFRAMDPGLIHIFHEKSCDPSRLTANQLRMCQDSRAQGYGSRQQIAKHLLHKGCSLDVL